MTLRCQTLRIARALTKELQPSAQRILSSAARTHRPNCYCLRNGISSHARSSSGFVSANDSSFRNFSTKPDETPSEQNSPEEEQNPPQPSPDDDDADKDSSPEVADADDEVTELESQIKDLKDSLLRSLAEQDNTRRIAARDVANARSFAISSFAKSLLDTSDNLSRALDAVPEELRNDQDNHPVLANLYEGITMTDDGLNKAFSKNGLVKFGEKGEKFDPNLHQALFEYPDPEGEAGHIGQVTKVGFVLNERVVRPAEVGVIKAP